MHCLKHLTIAGFSITLSSERAFILEDGYLPFLTENIAQKPEVIIRCHSGLPEVLFSQKELVFEAKNEEQRFYSVYRSGSRMGFVLYNQEHKGIVQQVACTDEALLQWDVYSTPDSEGVLVPLKYPFGPILLHYLTLQTDAVMIHASCAFDGIKGRVFTGFSGVGKSTMSKLWASAGNLIVNDDRLVIRKSSGGYTVFNTPMYYSDIPKEAPLNAIYLISHSPHNKIAKLSGALAVSRVMAFCIQNNFDPQYIASRLSFLSELCARIPVYELGFVPDNSVIQFIIDNEQ